MTKYALIQGTRICEFVATEQDRFDVHSGLSWVQVPDDTTTHDTYENDAVVSFDTYRSSTTLAEAVERKRSLLKNVFRDKRDMGITVTHATVSYDIATTLDAQQEIREMTNRTGGGGSKKAVTRQGTHLLYSNEIAMALLNGINDHHQLCNDAEYDHLVSILALTTIAEVDAYDISTGWPTGA